MKRILSVLLIIPLLLGCMALTACAHIEGLDFIKLSKAVEDGISLKAIDEYKGEKDEALLCIINEKAPEELTIPAEFNGKKVAVVTCGEGGGAELKALTIEDGVEAVENCFDKGSANLSVLTFGGKLKSIYNSFDNCKKLQKLSIVGADQITGSFNALPVTDLRFKGKTGTLSSSFGDCVKLTSVAFKDDVDTIDSEAFHGSSNIEELAFNGRVSKIADNIFNECEEITSLTFKGDVGTLGTNQFNRSKIKTLEFNGKVENFAGGFEANGQFYFWDEEEDEEKQKEILAPFYPELEKIIFHGDVGRIGDFAFQVCPKLKEVVFESKVETLGKEAFNYCHVLDSFTFKGDVGEIGDGALARNYKLHEIAFDGDVGTVTSNAFLMDYQLNKVIFNGKVNTVESYAFDDCNHLRRIEFHGDVENPGYSSLKELEEFLVPNGDSKIKTYLEGGAFDSGSFKIGIGDEDFFKFADQFDEETILKQVKKNIGKSLKASKKISEKNASKYAAKLNGPIITQEMIPNCKNENYSAKNALKDNTLEVFPMSRFERLFPGKLYGKDKAGAVADGKSKLVYCLVEKAGFSDRRDFVSNDGSVKEAVYFSNYRVSFWEYDSGKLLAWFTRRNGKELTNYVKGASGSPVSIDTVKGDKYYFVEKDKYYMTPEKCVAKAVFGVKKFK